MVDGYDHVYIERQGEQGQFENVTRSFQDEQHLLDVVRETAVSLGRPLGDGEWTAFARRLSFYGSPIITAIASTPADGCRS